MDASKITELLQKQNTRYINRNQTVDASTLIWRNQIQSSKYIKGVKTCDGDQNTNNPTNVPTCSNGIASFGGSGRTTAIQTGSSKQFLSVYSGASGSASQIYSSESILLQKAGKEYTRNQSVNQSDNQSANHSSFIVLPTCYCKTNCEVNNPINNNANPYLPPFDTYYKLKTPCVPVKDQNKQHFVKECNMPESNGVNDVFNPSLNVTTLDPVTREFHTTNSNPPACGVLESL